jgi:hypothetical protein
VDKLSKEEWVIAEPTPQDRRKPWLGIYVKVLDVVMEQNC